MDKFHSSHISNPSHNDGPQIWFTGNSISYLSTALKLPIDLKEWEWHIEVKNGLVCYVVTDKKMSGQVLNPMN